MLLPDALIDIVNQHLTNKVLCDPRFAGAQVNGIVEEATRKGGDKMQVFPAKFGLNGDGVTIAPNDTYPLQVWHKLKHISYRNGEGFGGGYANVIATLNLSMVVAGFTDKVQLTQANMVALIATNFPDAIAQGVVQPLKINLMEVRLQEANLDKRAVFGQEFQGYDFFIQPEQILFALKYQIEIAYRKGCFTMLDCQPVDVVHSPPAPPTYQINITASGSGSDSGSGDGGAIGAGNLDFIQLDRVIINNDGSFNLQGQGQFSGQLAGVRINCIGVAYIGYGINAPNLNGLFDINVGVNGVHGLPPADEYQFTIYDMQSPLHSNVYIITIFKGGPTDSGSGSGSNSGSGGAIGGGNLSSVELLGLSNDGNGNCEISFFGMITATGTLTLTDLNTGINTVAAMIFNVGTQFNGAMPTTLPFVVGHQYQLSFAGITSPPIVAADMVIDSFTGVNPNGGIGLTVSANIASPAPQIYLVAELFDNSGSPVFNNVGGSIRDILDTLPVNVSHATYSTTAIQWTSGYWVRLVTTTSGFAASRLFQI